MMMMRRLSQRGVWWRQLGLLLAIVKAAHAQTVPLLYAFTAMRQCYQWGADAACYCVKCECVCVCARMLFKHTCICMCAPEQQMEAGESSNNKLWVVYIGLSNQNGVFTFDHIFSPLPPSLPSFSSHSLLLRVLPWQRRRALRLAAPPPLLLPPELWFSLLKLPISLSDPLEREEEIVWIYFD